MNKTRQQSTRAIVTLVLLCTAPLASAVDVGMGLSLNTEGGGMGGYGASLPLRFGTFTVEPELSIYNSTQDSTYATSPTSNSTSDYSDYTLETGLYWRKQVTPSVETYVGGRVGYNKHKNSTKYPLNPSSNQTQDSSGYSLGPTLGAEFFFDKHFSLGVDVSLLYESTSGTSHYVSGSDKESGNNFNYQTRAKLRFYF